MPTSCNKFTRGILILRRSNNSGGWHNIPITHIELATRDSECYGLLASAGFRVARHPTQYPISIQRVPASLGCSSYLGAERCEWSHDANRVRRPVRFRTSNRLWRTLLVFWLDSTRFSSFTIKGLRLPAVGNNLALDQQRGCSAGIA
jgi:hypothetical protein